jgi:hypothetical protein
MLSADLVQVRERVCEQVREEGIEEISAAGIDSTAQGELRTTGWL